MYNITSLGLLTLFITPLRRCSFYLFTIKSHRRCVITRHVMPCDEQNRTHCVTLSCVFCCVHPAVWLPGDMIGSRSYTQSVVNMNRSQHQTQMPFMESKRTNKQNEEEVYSDCRYQHFGFLWLWHLLPWPCVLYDINVSQKEIFIFCCYLSYLNQLQHENIPLQGFHWQTKDRGIHVAATFYRYMVEAHPDDNSNFWLHNMKTKPWRGFSMPKGWADSCHWECCHHRKVSMPLWVKQHPYKRQSLKFSQQQYCTVATISVTCLLCYWSSWKFNSALANGLTSQTS